MYEGRKHLGKAGVLSKSSIFDDAIQNIKTWFWKMYNKHQDLRNHATISTYLKDNNWPMVAKMVKKLGYGPKFNKKHRMMIKRVKGMGYDLDEYKH